jgi:formylglycine-generating enzyme required for sulfatase activity
MPKLLDWLFLPQGNMSNSIRAIVWLSVVFGCMTLANSSDAIAASGDAIIIIANKTYRGGVAPVEYADRDADAMQRAAIEAMDIQASALRRFNDMTIGEANEWFRPDGTPGASLVEFIRKASGNRRNGTIYFYYSGHGVATRNDRRQQDEMHFVLFDTRTDAVGSQGLSIEAVKRALSQVQKDIVPAGQVVMMVDACFSGFGRDGKEVWKGARSGAVPAKLVAPDKVVILSAAGPTEHAWSDDRRQYGVFTDALMDGLYGGAADSAGRIIAERLQQFVERRIESRLSRASVPARTQRPILEGEPTTVLATLQTPFPERVPGAKARLADRCRRVEASLGSKLMRDFLATDCDEDCPCKARIKAIVDERERGEQRCQQDSEELTRLRTYGSDVKPTIEELRRTTLCKAVKDQADKALAELSGPRVFGLISTAPSDDPKPTVREPQVSITPRPGERLRDPLSDGRPCAECPEMVVVPAGSFIMGSPHTEADRDESEGPQHKVTFDRSFAVGRFETTFTEWDACVEAAGCNAYRPNDAAWGRGRKPVININWSDAQAYVSWLSRVTGKPYRLLTEAEWEYVARAGTTTRFAFGEVLSSKQARFSASTWGSARGTVSVGSYNPNGWGVHDMHGNVWEWVEDCWKGDYASAPVDGSAFTGGDCGRRVARGGSWYSRDLGTTRRSPTFNNDGLPVFPEPVAEGPGALRSAFRLSFATDHRNNNVGLRVARTLNP